MGDNVFYLALVGFFLIFSFGLILLDNYSNSNYNRNLYAEAYLKCVKSYPPTVENSYLIISEIDDACRSMARMASVEK